MCTDCFRPVYVRSLLSPSRVQFPLDPPNPFLLRALLICMFLGEKVVALTYGLPKVSQLISLHPGFEPRQSATKPAAYVD